MENNLLIRLLKTPRGAIPAAILLVLYLLMAFSDFLAPYSSGKQKLETTYHPHMALLWKDGHLHAQLYKNVDPSAAVYQPAPGETVPIHFFHQGEPYHLFGLIPSDIHFFGVEEPHRVYLLGSDDTGRDVFSRLLLGSRVSLLIGLLGLSVTMVIGLLVGGLSGYFGGWIDDLTMRFTELLMAIPGLYLLMALRSAFGQDLPPDKIFFVVVLILSMIGWAGTARVIRGMSLSIRQQPFVFAAEVMGRSPLQILIKHILPNTFSYLVVAATLSIPGYILGEAALSFLGLGIEEPSASWGLMLSQAQDMKVFMLNFWWLLSPGFAIFITVLCFNLLGDVLRDLVDPRLRIIK